MKNQKLLRCMMMATLMVIAGIFASGQVIIRNTPIGTDANIKNKFMFNIPDIDMNKYDVFQDEKLISYVPREPKQATEWDWENTVNVNFSVEYDEVMCNFPIKVGACPIGFSSWGMSGSFFANRNWIDGTYQRELAKGLYDLFVEFPSKVDKVKAFLVLMEGIDIHSDTTIVIDQRTSTNPMQIITRMPNGDIYDPNEQIYGEHTIQSGYFICPLVRKEDANTLVTFMGDEDGSSFFINNVSDRYAINYVCILINQSSDLFFVDHTSLGYNFPQENDPADWEYIEESFQPSAIDDGANNSMSISATFCHSGLAMLSRGINLPPGSATSPTLKMHVNAPKRDDDYVLLTQARYGHGAEVITNYEDGNGNIVFSDTTIQSFMINGVPTFVENGIKHYINNGPLIIIPYFGFKNEDGLVVRHGYPGNPAFAFTEAQKTSEFGSGTPICLFLYPELGNLYPNWAFAYVGRYGEVREVDQLPLEMRMTVNGTEVCNNYSLMNQFLMDPDRPTGKIDITMTNENIVVDGLQGRNYAQMHIDENNEDSDGPSLSMLWFKDGEDRITDRFASSQDGLLEFSAGDFNATFDINISENTWFTCAKPEVEVSYAPYGEDNWNELEVEEVPENFYMPCFGNFFRGSLAGVTGEALQGWFDLKVKLTDAAGNWQEQVISPAFRIDNLAYSSVASVGSGNAHEVARYNLAGQRVDANTPGVVIVKMSDGTARKVIVP